MAAVDIDDAAVIPQELDALPASALNDGLGVLYMVSFVQKVLNPQTSKYRNILKPSSSFYLSEHASFDQFKTGLFKHLSRQYDEDTIFAEEILTGTFKIARHIKNPHELLQDGTGYNLAMTTVKNPAKKADKVDLTLTQSKQGQKRRRAVNDVAGQDGWMRGRGRMRVNEEGDAVVNNPEGEGGNMDDRVRGGGAVAVAVGGAAQGIPAGRARRAGESDGDSENGGDLLEDIINEDEARRRREANIYRSIQLEWNCNTASCKGTHCWICPRTLSHIPLTIPHLKVWATAIMGKVAGVDVKNLPTHRFFDQNAALDQVQLRQAMIRTRNQQENVPLAPAPVPAQPIVINNHMPAMNAAPIGAAVEEVVDPIAAILNLDPLPLNALCERYGLSDEICRKAADLKITGAHGFCIISNATLEATFAPGELANIQLALRRWKLGR